MHIWDLCYIFCCLLNVYYISLLFHVSCVNVMLFCVCDSIIELVERILLEILHVAFFLIGLIPI